MAINLSFPYIRRLATRVRRAVAVLDLETSKCFPNEPVGITDWASVVVQTHSAKGNLLRSRVDPETPLDPDMIAITGIDLETLKKAKPWPVAGAVLFRDLQDSLVVGYFSRAYDVPVLQHQAKRYGLTVPLYRHHLDLGEYVADKGGRISLRRAGRLVGVEYQGPVHQATEDTLLTAWLLERLIERDGVDALYQFLYREVLSVSSVA